MRRTCGRSPKWPVVTARCCTSTMPMGSVSSASEVRTSPRRTGCAGTASCATPGRATTGSCSWAASPRPTRHCWPSSPARPRSSSCSRSRRRRTCTPARRRSRHWPRCSRASTSTSVVAMCSALSCTRSAHSSWRRSTGSTSRRRTARACRSWSSRCATTSASETSVACSSTAASTPRSPPTRWFRRMRSASASS